MNLAEAMASINVGPSRLAREVGGTTTPSTISDLRSGRIKQPGYQLVRRIFDALRALGLDESIALDDVFPVERGHQLPLPVDRRTAERRRRSQEPVTA